MTSQTPMSDERLAEVKDALAKLNDQFGQNCRIVCECFDDPAFDEDDEPQTRIVVTETSGDPFAPGETYTALFETCQPGWVAEFFHAAPGRMRDLLAEIERLRARDHDGLRWEGHLAGNLSNAQDALNDAAAEIVRLRSRVEIARQTAIDMARVIRDPEVWKYSSRILSDLGGHETPNGVVFKRLHEEIERLKTEISNAVDALSGHGREAYAVSQSLEDGINTDHLHAAAERDGLTDEVERLQKALSDRGSMWADVHDLLSEFRDSDRTDNELTNAVMALIFRVAALTSDQPGGSK